MEVEIEKLKGDLEIPEGAKALVVFAHGSGSSRKSSRNIMVATKLQEAGFATLLFDLLTAEEDKLDQVTMQYRFDIAMLASRLMKVTDWAKENHKLPIAYFGASTGAAAALIAASKKEVIGVISRGGRPDLADKALENVKAPVLLIVGSLDRAVIELNEQAYERLRCEKKLTIVEGATHLFEEEGKLEEVARLTVEELCKYT